jgi:RiboL-PSP-HEPN
MSSKALATFLANQDTVDDLLLLHGFVGGHEPGRRIGLEALNKAGVVLVCAIWEAYCEDLCLEALGILLGHASAATHIPKELRKRVASSLKADKNEIAVWALADSGWKVECERQVRETLASFNTPKTRQIDELFDDVLGLKGLSHHWSWKRIRSSLAASRLDAYVALRGDIAHRSRSDAPVRKPRSLASSGASLT